MTFSWEVAPKGCVVYLSANLALQQFFQTITCNFHFTRTTEYQPTRNLHSCSQAFAVIFPPRAITTKYASTRTLNERLFRCKFKRKRRYNKWNFTFFRLNKCKRWQQILCWCFKTAIVCPCLFQAIQLYWNFKLYCLYFFPNSVFQIGSVAYLRMRLIHGRLRYVHESYSLPAFTRNQVVVNVRNCAVSQVQLLHCVWKKHFNCRSNSLFVFFLNLFIYLFFFSWWASLLDNHPNLH